MGFDQSNIDDLLKEAGLASGGDKTAEGDMDFGGSVEDILSQAGGGDSDFGGPPAGSSAFLSGGAGAAPAAPKKSQPDMSSARPATFESFDSSGGASTGTAADIEDLLGDVQLKVQVVLGRSKMTVDEILQLVNGSVVELDKLAGDPLDILVNDRLVAKGEVLVLNENFCIRITDIIPPVER